jgi:hypothetical protein
MFIRLCGIWPRPASTATTACARLPVSDNCRSRIDSCASALSICRSPSVEHEPYADGCSPPHPPPSGTSRPNPAPISREESVSVRNHWISSLGGYCSRPGAPQRQSTTQARASGSLHRQSVARPTPYRLPQGSIREGLSGPRDLILLIGDSWGIPPQFSPSCLCGHPEDAHLGLMAPEDGFLLALCRA